MTGPASSTPDRNLSSTLWACLWLTLALVAIFPAFGAVGFLQHGNQGLAAAAVAGLICWVGASAALAMSGLLREPQVAVAGLLGGMFFRMGLPLAAGLLLHQRGGDLVEAGVMGHLIAYYLVALVVETALSLRFVGLNKVARSPEASKGPDASKA